jgi:polysaccharide export outer membrane protein
MKKQMKKTKMSPTGFGSVCLAFLCLTGSMLCGCRSTKSITYFQPASPELDAMVVETATAYTPVIKSGDILSISVVGLSEKDSEMFNPMTTMYSGSSQSVGIIMPQPITGFIVDAEGFISLPLIGKVGVAGLKSREVETKLNEQLQTYIKSPTVRVRIANYIVSVLGEVARPAQYVIPNERITLPEALAIAGDLTVYGKRENILIIREIDGKRHFARLDITNRDIFGSPYFYLHSGDILYVEPSTGKLTSTDRAYQLTPIIISSLSFLIMIFTSFIK